MPRGIPNKPKDITPPMNAGNAGNAGQTGPAPLIMIQPGPDGIQLDVYGIDAIEAIDDLRLTLLHLVAMQSDLPIIHEVFSRQTAVALPVRNPVPVSKPSRKGSGSKRQPYPRQSGYDDDWQTKIIDDVDD